MSKKPIGVGAKNCVKGPLSPDGQTVVAVAVSKAPKPTLRQVTLPPPLAVAYTPGIARSRCERIAEAMLRFDPVLAVRSRFTEQELAAAGFKAGPCAMGPVPDQSPASMHVWVFQHVQGGIALASGDTRRDPVFETVPEPRWKVRTLLDPGSKQFEVGKPAVAHALAVLGDGEDVLEWSQGVMIETNSPFRGNEPA